jgi:hypothetical protein
MLRYAYRANNSESITNQSAFLPRLQPVEGAGVQGDALNFTVRAKAWQSRYVATLQLLNQH